MFSIQDVIIHLQMKIGEYRDAENRVVRAKEKIKTGKATLISINNEIKTQILGEIKDYKDAMQNTIIKVNDYFESQIQKQKKCYQRELYQLRLEIQRQYKVISSMRQEVEDLQELIIMQNAKNETIKQSSQGKQQQKEEQKKLDFKKFKPIYQLEVIEQETERTAMSSVKSFQEESRCTDQNFIRIQEKQNESYSQSECISSKKESSIKIKKSHHIDSICSQSQYSRNQQQESMSEHPSQSKSSISKLQLAMMNSSNASKRQNTYQYDENSQQDFEKYELMPIHNGYITKEFNPKQFMKDKNKDQMINNCMELREITNQINHSCSEQDRQQKTKIFLKEFRKTFNRCLSSTTISRKSSAKQEKQKNQLQKSKSREDKKKSSKQKTKIVIKPQNQKVNSQKILNDMLKDTYNNSKFYVGDRRNQQKYDGDRKDNARNGHGKLLYVNCLCYQGEFKDNLRHGYGILRFNTTQIYRGEWQEDEMSGQGKIKNFGVINKTKSQADSSPLSKWVSYCGYFKSNRFEGQGTLYLQAGQKFLGKFICGAACGQGTLYKKNGDIQTGVWRNNQLVEQF